MYDSGTRSGFDLGANLSIVVHNPGRRNFKRHMVAASTDNLLPNVVNILEIYLTLPQVYVIDLTSSTSVHLGVDL